MNKILITLVMLLAAIGCEKILTEKAKSKAEKMNPEERKIFKIMKEGTLEEKINFFEERVERYEKIIKESEETKMPKKTAQILLNANKKTLDSLKALQ